MQMPEPRRRVSRPVQPLRYFVTAVVVYVGVEVLCWAAHPFELPERTRMAAAAAMLAVEVVTFVGLTSRLAVRAGHDGVLVSSVISASAVYTSQMILLALGALWLPGLYQIDYDTGEFVRDKVTQTIVVSWAVAALAALVGLAAIHGTRRVRRWVA
jgi:hypothetical protein